MTIMLRRFFYFVSIIAISSWLTATGWAQNVGVTTPFSNHSNSSFSTFGFGFGANQPPPPFGGYNPNSGGRLSYQGNGFSIGLNFAQGSTRTSTTTAPSLVVQNGFGGSISSGQFRPFLTGLIPIVGDPGPPPIDNAVTRAVNSGQLDLQYQPNLRPVVDLESANAASPRGSIYAEPSSTAERGDLSVAAIKAQRARESAIRKRALTEAMAEAETCLQSGDRLAARKIWRAALKLTDDTETVRSIKAKLAATK